MWPTPWFLVLMATWASVAAPGHTRAQEPSPGSDASLLVYAVRVIHDRPLREPFSGYGVYLGKGMVITAAHVLGHWPSFIANPRVLIAGQESPAKVIKQGSSDTTDLALLSIDEGKLPISLQLRRNPLCKEPPKAGENVIVVVTQGIAHSQILFPQSLPPSERTNFATFIADVWIPGGSGSGVFHAERKCLLGIIITKLIQDNYSLHHGRMVRDLARSTADAKHFVPAAKISEFIPPEFRF